MKKRLLSALLALALVFVLLPTTALAEVTTGDDYDISINGKGWKFEKDTTSGAYIPVRGVPFPASQQQKRNSPLARMGYRDPCRNNDARSVSVNAGARRYCQCQCSCSGTV